MSFANPEENIRQFGIKEGMLVADFGAGSGAYALAAVEVVGRSGKVYAVEVQKEFLESVTKAAQEKRLSNIEVIWGDIENLGGTKIGDQQVDAVILSNVLFQVADKKGVVAEAKRILKPHGMVLVVDWLGSFGGLGPRQSEIFPEAQAWQLLGEHGFEIQKEIVAGDNHYGFIAQLVK